ncbi:MAG: putative two-component system sensor kinase [Frankiales bacterium]|nr:putative two-component system sensor kinase [Frankiales bacterium]
MKGPRTLRGRLALSATLTAGTAVVLLTVLFGVLLDRRLTAEAENVLRGRAESALATVHVQGAALSSTESDAALDTGIWLYQGGTAIERPRGASVLQAEADRLAGTDNKLVRRQKSEFLSVAVRSNGRQVGTLVAAISLEPYQRSARATIIGALALGTVLVALVYAVARNVATRALRPVAEMTRQAGEWSATDTSGRFGGEARPGELEELATTLDGVLGRLSAVLRREQQLSAEISHELRTPLTSIIAESDLFAARPRTPAEAAAAMTVIGDGARRMERILDTLLTAARAEAGAIRGRCDVVSVAHRLVDDVEAAPAVQFAGAESEVVERLLSPLVDNAFRYSAAVRMTVRSTATDVLVDVLDDGPGVPAGAEEAIFDAGYRHEPDDGHAGAGLGLALTRRLARATGGEVTAAAGPGGRFTVRLPRA